MEDQKQGGAEPAEEKPPPPSADGPENGAPRSDATTRQSDGQADSAQQQLDRDLVKWTKGLAWWTKALALFTGALVIAAVLQFWVMRSQLTEMTATRESGDRATAAQLGVMRDQATAMQHQLEEMKAAATQTERAISATNKLAGEAARAADESHRLADAAIVANVATKQLATAAISANQINRQSVVGVQRAFIVVKAAEFEPLDHNGQTGQDQQWFTNVSLENSGNTPTVDLHVRTRCTDASERVADPYVLPGLGLDVTSKNSRFGDLRKLEFGPKQSKIVQRCPVQAPIRRADGTSNHKIVTYLFGSIVYRDALDQASIHVTEFCYWIERTTFPLGPRFAEIDAKYREISLCQTHNCSDDECQKDDVRRAAEDLAPIPKR